MLEFECAGRLHTLFGSAGLYATVSSDLKIEHKTEFFDFVRAGVICGVLFDERFYQLKQ